jgi:fluoride exporter
MALKLSDLETYILIATGGFAGALSRYYINELVPSMPGILVINVAGCFLLGFLMYESIYVGAFSQQTRLVCGAGFIGAFTTFSTFSLQTFTTSPAMAFSNVVTNVLLGLVAVFLGRVAAIRLGGIA